MISLTFLVEHANNIVLATAVNGAVSAAQNTQTGQSKKYSGMSSDSMSTVSYKDAKVVVNLIINYDISCVQCDIPIS
jgi:hypothetical protein